MISTTTTTIAQREHFNCRMSGPADGPVLVLSNSLGTNLSMWEEQLPALTQRFRVLRYDTRGHGASSVTPGPYTITQLGRDVVGLLDALKIQRAHFCGLSLGGVTGMWLGVNAADRIDRLVLANTAPKIYTLEVWNARIENVRKGGLESIADAVIGGWLTQGFRDRDPAAAARMRAMLTASPAEGYLACCAAIRDSDQRETIRRIKSPTLIISGTHDKAAPPAEGRKMAEAIAGARYVELDAAHISNVECAESFTSALTGFLAG
jgi:3-oxoadipate enol-lactonase